MDKNNIQDAISAIEANRHELGDEVASVAIEVLQAQLADLAAMPKTQTLDTATVLVADLSGFTAMSELMDAEEVRDTVNAIWQKIDSVVESWGGHIDKHVGDGIIALFGVPDSQEDDTERAVHAALDMQMELALFNERATQLSTRIFNNWMRSPDMQMRIGISNGPVFMGRVGAGGAYTAIGKTVDMAMELEQQAPLGGVLVSEEVYALVRGVFDAERHEPVALTGYREKQPVYVVQREKPQAYQVSGLGISLGTGDLSARLVGRVDEMNQLQSTVQLVVDTSSAHLVTVAGEMGVGKTRLTYAFEEWLEHGPQETAVFRGHVQYDVSQSPFWLMRDALSSYFGIYPRGSAKASREKLEQGIIDILEGDDVARKREQAHFIGQLLGFDFSDSPDLQGVLHSPERIREFAFQDLAMFFTAVARRTSLVVLILENIQHADEGSLNLIEYLLFACRETPLMVVATARPALWEKRPSWRWLDALYPYRCAHMPLQPLSAIDSRLLTKELIGADKQLPLDFLDQIVSEAGGNPLFIEEYLKLVLDLDVVVQRGQSTHFELTRMPALPQPPTLADVQAAQLALLSDVEQQVLQLAAVIGWVFWETAVVELVQSVTRSLSLAEMEAAMTALERKQLIYRRRTSLLAGVPEFKFRHDSVQIVAYNQIEPDRRRQLDRQAASWFTTVAQREGLDFALWIAQRHAAAGDAEKAAEWFTLVANNAVEQFGPETAILFYNQAMTWFNRVEGDSQTGPSAYKRLLLYAGLGRTLLWRARIDEAITVFAEMLALAERHADYERIHEASLGLFFCADFQGNLREMEQHARLALESAQTKQEPRLVCVGMAALAWAQMRRGDLEQAERTAVTAVDASAEALLPVGMAFSNMVLGNVNRLLARFDTAGHHLEKAAALLRQNGEHMWEGLAMLQLGHVARDEQAYDLAHQRYKASLRIARELGDQIGTMLALQSLGRTCLAQEQYGEAERYLRQALLLAEKYENKVHQAHTANLLGKLYHAQYTRADSLVDELARQEHWEEAETWFNRVIASETELSAQRAPLLARLGLSELLLAAGRPQDALMPAHETVDYLVAQGLDEEAPMLPKRTDVAARGWRILGNIAADLPKALLPLVIVERPYQARDCFVRAVQLYNLLGTRFDVDRAYALRDWAIYEIYEGDQRSGKEMWSEALAIFMASGLQQEVDWMSSFVY